MADPAVPSDPSKRAFAPSTGDESRLDGKHAVAPATPRERRLAEALRANLGRRKARDRAEKAARPADDP